MNADVAGQRDWLLVFGDHAGESAPELERSGVGPFAAHRAVLGMRGHRREWHDILGELGGRPRRQRDASEGYDVFCTNCGNQNPDVAKFCAICGTPVNGSQSSNRQPAAALETSQPSEPAVERCSTVVKLVKQGRVMAQKSRIIAEGWGPRGPYVVDGVAPAIYYTPDSYRQARYGDEWSRAVHALFGRLSEAGWVHEREAASGKWWEQHFVRPVSDRTSEHL